VGLAIGYPVAPAVPHMYVNAFRNLVALSIECPDIDFKEAAEIKVCVGVRVCVSSCYCCMCPAVSLCWCYICVLILLLYVCRTASPTPASTAEEEVAGVPPLLHLLLPRLLPLLPLPKRLSRRRRRCRSTSSVKASRKLEQSYIEKLKTTSLSLLLCGLPRCGYMRGNRAGAERFIS
jgi:hypothetical protein